MASVRAEPWTGTSCRPVPKSLHVELDLVGHGELGSDGEIAALVKRSWGDRGRRASRIT
jgi:hypothetical protein